MKNKVRIIIPYFGKFPETMETFLLSCKRNPNFQWLIFTDDKLENVPDNVAVEYCTLNDIKALMEKKLGFQSVLNAPYKLCDYRPAYGVIFEDYLKGYDFWGYGDVDVVYGDLSHFITDELLEEYDKIYPCGHLSLVRNQAEVNRAFEVELPNALSYKEVFFHDKAFSFDEYRGLNEKLMGSGKKVYGHIDFADMDVVYKRFRTADKKTMRLVFFHFPFRKHLPKNYRNQTFYHEDGKSYRAYIDKKGNITHQEVVYIHYRHKIPCHIKIQESSNLYVTPGGFEEKTGEISKEVILTQNPYPGMWHEWREYLRLFKDLSAYILGRNKTLRNLVRRLKGKEKIE